MRRCVLEKPTTMLGSLYSVLKFKTDRIHSCNTHCCDVLHHILFVTATFNLQVLGINTL